MLLLILFSNRGVVPAVPDPGDCHIKYSILTNGYDRTVVSITKHTVVKDWIKVRYKGGETPIFGAMVPIHIFSFVAGEQIKGLKYIPFVSLPYYYCSNLRGPPGYLS